MKRARARKRRGVVHRVSVDVYFADLDIMKKLNLIRAADIDDRDAVEEAVSSYFAVSLWADQMGAAPVERFGWAIEPSKGAAGS